MPEPVDVFVTSRRLHFNYWQARPEQRHVTSLLENSESGEASVGWKRRGVKPLAWKGGQWHWARGYGSPEKIAELWQDVAQPRVGIMIDEFGGGDEIDQQMGDALALTRHQRQDLLWRSTACRSRAPK